MRGSKTAHMEYKLPKKDFSGFVNAVMGSFDVIAPVAGDASKRVQKTQFQAISKPEDITITTGPTYFPAKYYFFDKKETLFEFKGHAITDAVIKLRDRVFFGLRRCDLTGIKHQDMVFSANQEDPYYKTRRDASILIGLHCPEGDNYCFCNSMTNSDYFDVMFYDKDDVYLVEIGSKKGQHFIERFQDFFTEAQGCITPADKEIKNTFHLDTTDIKKLYFDQRWEELANTCISCGACNTLCPNCHCFTIQDEIAFDLQTGKRVRTPASCQLKSFTRVAGEHIFRDTRVARYKHRIYHQIEYFRDRHDELFCTGCGRCIRGCPVRIDWVSHINKMNEQDNK